MPACSEERKKFGLGEQGSPDFHILPISPIHVEYAATLCHLMKQFKQIQESEFCDGLLSPKADATSSQVCLEGVFTSFHGLSGSSYLYRPAGCRKLRGPWLSLLKIPPAPSKGADIRMASVPLSTAQMPSKP